MQGRAAEALGLIGEPAKASAGAIARMVLTHLSAGALTGVDPNEQRYPLAAPIEAVRLGVYALVRLGDVAALRSAVLAADGNPSSDWWPLAFALQRVRNAETLPALRIWLVRGGSITRGFAIKGLGELKDAASRPAIEALAGDERQPLGVRVQAIRALGAIADPRSADVLIKLLPAATPGLLRLEATVAIGAMSRPALAESLIDYLEEDVGADAGGRAGGDGPQRRRLVHAGALGTRQRSRLERAGGTGDDPRHALARGGRSPPGATGRRPRRPGDCAPRCGR